MMKDITLDNTRREPLAGINYAEVKTAKPAWYWIVANYAKSNLRKSSWQIVNTLGSYGLLWV
ncbi:MAG TPA: hypothetical protein VFS84_01775, partial [Candidatus Binatia bacterium]|nr:hypothetical protein [Candidatus Binatia bacterium]